MRIAVFRHRMAPGTEPFIERQLRGLGPDVHPFTIARSTMPGLDIWSLADHALTPLAVPAFQLTRHSRALRAAVRACAPDVMMAHFAQDAWRIERVTRQLRLPLVAVVHGSDALVSDSAASQVLGLSARQLRGHWADLASSVSLFLPVSDHVAGRLLERGVPAAKIARHYLGVDVAPARSPEETSYDVGFVGRLEPNKGGLGLVRALADHAQRLRPDRPLRVLVIGEGSEREAIDSLALQAEQLQVDLVGRVAPEDVAPRMATCAVIACPSVRLESGVGEGLGLTSLEAQSAGRPVVAFSTGGLPETVRDGDTGLLVPSGDWPALVEAIAGLLADPARREAMGRAGRRWVEQAWDAKRQNSALVSLLEQRVS